MWYKVVSWLFGTGSTTRDVVCIISSRRRRSKWKYFDYWSDYDYRLASIVIAWAGAVVSWSDSSPFLLVDSQHPARLFDGCDAPTQVVGNARNPLHHLCIALRQLLALVVDTVLQPCAHMTP